MAKKPSSTKVPPAAKQEDNLESVLGATAPSNSQLNEISVLVDRAVELMTSIDNLQEAVKGYNSELRVLLDKNIPDAMVSSGSLSFKTLEGVEVVIKDILEGSIPREDEVKRSAAIKWIETHGGASIIKAKMESVFDRGDRKILKVVSAALKKLKVAFTIKEDIHAKTLSSWARDRIKNGEEVPVELLGLYAIKTARIIMPDKQEKA